MKIGLIKGTYDQVENFLELKEDIDIAFSTTKVIALEEHLKTNIYEIDKIIFLDDHSEIEMKEDLIALKEVIGGKNFFKVDKIEFVTLEEKQTNKSFIEYIMKDIDVEFNINVESKYSLSNLYNYILGKYKVDKDTSNSYIDIILKKKGDKSKVQVLDKDEEYNTFSELSEEIQNYEKLKMKIFNTLPEKYLDDGRRFDVLQELDEKIYPYLKEKDFEETKKNSLDLTLLTGLNSSGKTTLSIAMATSLLHLNQKVIIIDLSDNNSTTSFLESFDVEISKFNLKDFNSISNFKKWVQEIEDNVINLITFDRNLFSEKTIKFFINNIMLETRINYDAYILVDFPFMKVHKYVNLLKKATRIIFNSTPRRVDIDSLKNELYIFDDFTLENKEKILVLNSVYNENIESPEYGYEKLQEIFTEIENLKITSKLSMKGYNVSGVLAKELLGGVNNAETESTNSN